MGGRAGDQRPGRRRGHRWRRPPRRAPTCRLDIDSPAHRRAAAPRRDGIPEVGDLENQGRARRHLLQRCVGGRSPARRRSRTGGGAIDVRTDRRSRHGSPWVAMRGQIDDAELPDGLEEEDLTRGRSVWSIPNGNETRRPQLSAGERVEVCRDVARVRVGNAESGHGRPRVDRPRRSNPLHERLRFVA